MAMVKFIFKPSEDKKLDLDIRGCIIIRVNYIRNMLTISRLTIKKAKPKLRVVNVPPSLEGGPNVPDS